MAEVVHTIEGGWKANHERLAAAFISDATLCLVFVTSDNLVSYPAGALSY